jgi:hypothetical protein
MLIAAKATEMLQMPGTLFGKCVLIGKNQLLK